MYPGYVSAFLAQYPYFFMGNFWHYYLMAVMQEPWCSKVTMRWSNKELRVRGTEKVSGVFTWVLITRVKFWRKTCWTKESFSRQSFFWNNSEMQTGSTLRLKSQIALTHTHTHHHHQQAVNAKEHSMLVMPNSCGLRIWWIIAILVQTGGKWLTVGLMAILKRVGLKSWVMNSCLST